MISKVAQLQEATPMLPLCGLIDIGLRKLKKTSIFMVGPSRSGKSTLFNYINNIQLYGVPPEGAAQFDPFGISNAQIDVVYAPKIISSITAESNNGMKSVTLLPNISDRGEYTLVDLPGYLDKRKHNAVVGVSWVLKASLQIVEHCQFLLVFKFDFFRNGPQLFRAFRGFMNMFNFDEMLDQSKNQLLRSVTLVVTKSPKNVKKDPYITIMKNFLIQGQDPFYGDAQNVKKIAYVMEYFTQHPQQIYLFGAAQINQNAPPCTIVQEHFKERSYFPMKHENQKFLQKHRKTIYRLPFTEDFGSMPTPLDRQNLNDDINNRIRSFKQFAKILEKFFRKAINVQNLFNGQLSLKQQFEEMKEYVTQYHVYSKQFDEKIETGLKSTFSMGDPQQRLKIGIRLAQNVFKLYKLFSQWPEYDNEDDPSTLETFMKNYQQHLVIIIDLFRNSFCTKWQQELIIVKFLFVAVRGCRQFSMLYQIRPDGKNDMCIQLKDSFEAIVNNTPLKKLLQQFVYELHSQIHEVINNIASDKEEIDQYIRFLRHLPYEEEGGYELSLTPQYKELLKIFLKLKGKLSLTLEQSLLSAYQNFIEHKKTVEDTMKQLNDEEGDYPDHLNFTFIHLLSTMGNILLGLQRSDNLEEDNFAYERSTDIVRMKGKCSVKQYLVIEQAGFAKEIFTYIGDVQSVLESYELILKNTPETDYSNRLQYMKGMANFCLKGGRIEQAIILFQKLLKLCATANLGTQYQKIKQMLGKIPAQKEDKLKIYFNELKHKQNIDPTDDRQLDDITQNIEYFFITPYKQKLEEQQHANQN